MDSRLLYCKKCKGWHRGSHGCLDDGTVENCSWRGGWFEGFEARFQKPDEREKVLRDVRAARQSVAAGQKPSLWHREVLDRFCTRDDCGLCGTTHSLMEGCAADGKSQEQRHEEKCAEARRKYQEMLAASSERCRVLNERAVCTLPKKAERFIRRLQGSRLHGNTPFKRRSGRALVAQASELSMRFPCQHGKDDAGEEHSICRDEKCFLGWFLKYAIADLPPDEVAVVALERSITQMKKFGGNL